MLGISMRRMIWKYSSGDVEIRDGIDTEWWSFLKNCLPEQSFLPLPNIGKDLESTLINIPFSGFILTGGDDLGVFPERDETEKLVFELAQSKSLPILGVCRGAQVINCLMGGTLSQVIGHVGARHTIFQKNSKTREVNSWHANAIVRLGHGLMTEAVDGQNYIEAFSSEDGRIQGVMWHPEREKHSDPRDQDLITKMFSGGIK